MRLHESREIVEQCRVAITKKEKEKIEEDGKTKEIMVEKHYPCPRIAGDGTCTTYMWPAAKWYQSNCPFSHGNVIVEGEEKMLNPLKASKRSRRKSR